MNKRIELTLGEAPKIFWWQRELSGNVVKSRRIKYEGDPLLQRVITTIRISVKLHQVGMRSSQPNHFRRAGDTILVNNLESSVRCTLMNKDNPLPLAENNSRLARSG